MRINIKKKIKIRNKIGDTYNAPILRQSALIVGDEEMVHSSGGYY